MVGKFTAAIDDWVLETEKRINAVLKQATQTVINTTQLSTSKGGRMRVDTGFLRASGQLSLNGMPSGPIRGEPGQTYAEKSVKVTLSDLKSGSKIYFGWTAKYAKERESKDAFLALAVQKWPQIVENAANQLKARSK